MYDFLDDNCLSDDDKLLGSSQDDCSGPSTIDSELELTLIESNVVFLENDATVNNIQENLRDLWIENLPTSHIESISATAQGTGCSETTAVKDSGSVNDKSASNSHLGDINAVKSSAEAVSVQRPPVALLDTESEATIPVASIGAQSSSAVNNSVTEQTAVNSERRKIIMASSDEESVVKPDLHLVLVAPADDECIFSKTQGDKIAGKVAAALKAEENSDVKIEFSGPDRGQFKFVCSNESAKKWAMSILPKLEGLFDKMKLKIIDQGIIPKLVKASCIFNNKVPNFVDFCEEMERKKDNLDTLHWPPYNNSKIKGERTILFFGIDEASSAALKNIGFRPYYETGRIKITVVQNK
ncbi:hypothetical protein HA402_006571 [Bradysia odoriphaga]|nr:hypothetical protein HA402_006571 [Bradysia odoriphaga]